MQTLATPPVSLAQDALLGTQEKMSLPLDRAQILDATAIVLRERGYDGTTIRRIAEKLDCAVGSIYRYFRDKRDLLDGVCQRRFESVAEHAELGMSVAKCASLYARTVADQPDLYRLMFWLTSVEQAADAQALPSVIRRIIASWGTQFETPGAASRFWAQLHGTMMEGLSADQAMEALGFTQAAAPVAAPARAQAVLV